MEDSLLTGVGALDESSKTLFVQHCMDSDNWAGSGKRKSILMSSCSDEVVAKASKVASKSESASAAAKMASKSESASVSAEGKGQSSATTVSVQDPAAGSISIVSGSFQTPVPGVHGAHGDDFLKGKTFVITGTFPEAGESDAGAEGVTIIKAMIQSFGGKVITKFSTKTSEYRNFELV
jgi:NAD-dependent DNA ligase